MNLSVIILAAGAGTRMRSSKPKVLHEIAGLPMVEHVYNTSMSLGARQVQVVYGHGGEQLKQRCQHFDVEWVLQDKQLGTAHAVQQASPQIDDDNVALILYGDVPLIKTETLSELVGKVSDNNVSLLTVKLEHLAAGLFDHGLCRRRIPFRGRPEARVDVRPAFGHDAELERTAHRHHVVVAYAFEVRVQTRAAM
mgnify:CR=1 FL=1